MKLNVIVQLRFQLDMVPRSQEDHGGFSFRLAIHMIE